MERVNKILKDETYLSYLKKNKKAEKDRKFCVHNLQHLLDVCRIGYAMILEEGLPYDKELFYTAGLLHDIGRWQQVESGVDHAKASAELAEDILIRYGYDESERSQILTAIAAHRIAEHPDDFSRILYKADKLSRECWKCKEIANCKRFQNGEVPELTY